MKDQANFDGLLTNYKANGHELEYQGEAMVREKPTHKIKVMREKYPDVLVYLDAESYLEVKSEGEGVNPQTGGTVIMETYMSDYRPVNGVMLPHAMEVVMGGTPFQTVTFGSIDANVEIDNDLFEIPGVSTTPSTN
jgi:hypothetical protein